MKIESSDVVIGYMLLCWTVLFVAVFTIPEISVEANYDVIGVVGCKTNSMGLVLECNDKLYGDYVDEDTVLVPGSIYVYKVNDTSRVVHRLILCLDENCTRAVFRGDNNGVGEVVNRSHILYDVQWIRKASPSYVDGYLVTPE